MVFNIFSILKNKNADGSTMRTELNVPFKEKDIVKKMGAKWDPEKKVWYVPSGVNLEDFKSWIVTVHNPGINFKADSFFIAETSGRCWKCSKNTRFISLGLYPGFLTEVLEEDENDPSETSLVWVEHGFYALLYYVREIPEDVCCHIQSLSSCYKIDHSSTAKRSYWMNHCEYCGAKQGDFMEYCEPDGLFSGDYIGSNIIRHNISNELIVNCDGYNPCSILEDN